MISYEVEGVKGPKNETKAQLHSLIYTAKKSFTFPFGRVFLSILIGFIFHSSQHRAKLTPLASVLQRPSCWGNLFMLLPLRMEILCSH